jgi:hypothetical protein
MRETHGITHGFESFHRGTEIVDRFRPGGEADAGQALPGLIGPDTVIVISFWATIGAVIER